MYYVPEITRFFILAEFGSPRFPAWSLASTTEDWWIEHWSELECSPESLDTPSKAMEALREENARKKRLEEEQGPTNMDAVETKQETPEQAFRRIFQDVSAAAATAAAETRSSFTPPPSSSPTPSGGGGGAGGKLWYRPICQYTQRNVYDAVMLLCERIQDYPFHEDIVTLIELLTARVGVLFLQPGKAWLFDIPRYREQLNEDGFYRANRAFMAWAAAYFYELLQRVYYHRTLRVRWQPIAVLQTQVRPKQSRHHDASLTFCVNDASWCVLVFKR
jgi:hypothetical protein